MSIVNFYLYIINKFFVKYVRILVRIRVDCSELGLRYEDIFLVFIIKIFGRGFFMYCKMCIC